MEDTTANTLIFIEEEFEQDVDFKQEPNQKDRAIRRKNKFVKQRKADKIQSLKKESELCPPDKKIRKKACVRKARYSNDNLNNNSYKKLCRLNS